MSSPKNPRVATCCMLLACLLALGRSAPAAPLEALPDPPAASALAEFSRLHPALEPHPEPAYHFQNEILACLAGAAGAGDGRLRPIVLGTSVQGRSLWAFALRDPGRPVHRRMLVVAALHPMEWVPSEIALAFALEFLASPIEGVELVVVPVANPDGRAAVERSLRRGKNTFSRGNARGVDLNRDFALNREPGDLWGRLLPAWHTTSDAALSQPESRALDELAARAHFDLFVSLHAFGGYIFTPWAGRWERPSDWRAMEALGRRMAEAQGPRGYQVGQLSRWAFFFRLHGSEIDHFHGRYGVPSFLVETTRTGIEPLDPSTWRSYFRRYNPRDPTRHVDLGVALLRASAGALAESLSSE